jgi:hypothetical protein
MYTIKGIIFTMQLNYPGNTTNGDEKYIHTYTFAVSHKNPKGFPGHPSHYKNQFLIFSSGQISFQHQLLP